jgi:hypothetical protein
VLVGSPLLAQRLIDALGLLAEPSARSALIRIAEAPPQGASFLQIAAIRALSKYPYDEALSDLFTRLTSANVVAAVRQAAITEVVRSEIQFDAETVSGFIDSSSGLDAVPFLQEVAKRRLAGCADACARKLDDEVLRVRQTAILALLSLRDERGVAAGLEELAHAEPARAVLGLTLWRDADLLPPIDAVRPFAESRSAAMRKELAAALGAKGGGQDEEAAIALLRRLADDSDLYVSQTAVQQLWKHGLEDGLEKWRERLRRSYGADLREAAKFLCETLRDPQAAPILRDRLARERLDATDQANLLDGLRQVGDASDAPAYVERILRAGTKEDGRASERTFLSEYASLYVQGLGEAAVPPLVAALPRAPGPRARLALLDALRGVVKGAADADAAADAVLALLLDAGQPIEVRRAALDTIAFFDDAALGARLVELAGQVGEPELAERIRVLDASFF